MSVLRAHSSDAALAAGAELAAGWNSEHARKRPRHVRLNHLGLLCGRWEGLADVGKRVDEIQLRSLTKTPALLWIPSPPQRKLHEKTNRELTLEEPRDLLLG